MIRFVQGNLLEAPVEALVNTVNEVGVMGKGIARSFKEAFPEASSEYEDAARLGQVTVGHVLVTLNRELLGPRWIIHFPTKKHWRNPSKLAWVRDGLEDLVRVVRDLGIRSIALPPLGCGNGGLEWSHVKREIEGALAELPEVAVTVYEPTDRYFNAPKRAGVEVLTEARALIVELIRRYSVLGLECTNLEVQKLAWLLERTIRVMQLPNPLGLKFTGHLYGPYADRLRHLLNALDGSYLHSEKRLSDAKPLDPIWFDDARRAEVQAFLSTEEASAYSVALEATATLIHGFESPLGLELLATVDWMVSQEHVEPTVPALREELPKWRHGGKRAGQRKARIFDDRLLGLALQRLNESPLAPDRSKEQPAHSVN